MTTNIADEPARLTQDSFGLHVGITQSIVSDLVARRVIDLTEGLEASTLKYIAHLREQAAGRAAAGDLDLAAERARLAAEQADRLAMVNAEKRR